jgi:hypothetical protein
MSVSTEQLCCDYTHANHRQVVSVGTEREVSEHRERTGATTLTRTTSDGRSKGAKRLS